VSKLRFAHEMRTIFACTLRLTENGKPENEGLKRSKEVSAGPVNAGPENAGRISQEWKMQDPKMLQYYYNKHRLMSTYVRTHSRPNFIFQVL